MNENPVGNMVEINSEIGELQAVMLHRPGAELERLTPHYLGELLFEDIPWVEKIREEHDAFAETLRREGVTVYYHEELLTQVLQDVEIRRSLVDEVLAGCRIGDRALRGEIRAYLLEQEPRQLVETLMVGLSKQEERKHDIGRRGGGERLSDYIREDYPFFVNPLPNLYFTRDPATVIGGALSINSMNAAARARETLFLSYIHAYHPLFGEGEAPLLYQPGDLDSIEGGDILVLSDDAVMIGCSERTSTEAIERLARRLFDRGYREVLVAHIPFVREYMHLDTVCTMVDRDAFAIFPGVSHHIRMYRITPREGGGLTITPRETIGKALKEALQLHSVRMIETGGGDEMTAAREQWNDSTNTLAIAPGKVITYDRNVHSNRVLRDNGIEVVEIEGSELVRGRGGPRCMSMPLSRRALK
jgi:arginine deiminase